MLVGSGLYHGRERLHTILRREILRWRRRCGIGSRSTGLDIVELERTLIELLALCYLQTCPTNKSEDVEVTTLLFSMFLKI